MDRDRDKDSKDFNRDSPADLTEVGWNEPTKRERPPPPPDDE